MRSILVHADRSPAMGARLDTALALARESHGHVTVLVDTPVTRYVAMDPMGGSYLASEALQRALTEDDSHAAELEQRLAGEGVPFRVIRAESDPVEALAKGARLADVIIVSRSTGLAGEVALASRCPVLVLADEAPPLLPLTTACVAWDGGDEAALALRGAAPLLARCENVEVLTVKEKPGGFAADVALRYLAVHGVAARLHELDRKGSTEATLEVAVAQLGARLLVMGAFGHSRLREYLFGGVTRHFLEGERQPSLLLAH